MKEKRRGGRSEREEEGVGGVKEKRRGGRSERAEEGGEE